MTSSGSVFNNLPSRYDTLQKQCLPNWQTFFATVIEFIPESISESIPESIPESISKLIPESIPEETERKKEKKNREIEILELGSGTGFLTSLIRKKRPDARITCIDRNSEMLAVAKEKPELQKNVTFIEGDILEECEKWKEKPGWQKKSGWKENPEIKGKFDAVVSTQCLFSLPPDAKTRIFRRIYEALKPDGRFIEGDIFRPESEWEEEIYRAHWKRYMVEQELTVQEAEEMLGTFEDVREKIDTPEKFRKRLEEAGFKWVFCPYWYEMYAIFVGNI
ncbi:class I SAM-dependent methyltransferase [Methanosarcina sp. WH1]|nr:class I SAM-dependent methyltransferase [Methanosarcina sp. WH1]AKB23445.1 Methyltransferase [Methanosarcina sp. WH1]